MRMIRLMLLLAALVAMALPATAAIILPPDGLSMNSIHQDFAWTRDGTPDNYHLVIVEDNGEADPFDGVTPVIDDLRGGANHRTVVDTALEFGKDYAWHVRTLNSSTYGSWQPTHRFTIEPVPFYVPTITATTTGMGSYNAGLTLFNIRSPNGTVPGGLALIVDQAGQVLWFLETPDQKITDIRQLDGDRYLYNGSERAWEVLTNGQVAWISPLSDDLRVHHETFKMPNGNVLVTVHDYEQVDVAIDPDPPELQWWKGDRFVELVRANNNLAWEWRTFDHFSTEDFDPTEMASAFSGPGEPAGGSYDWSHCNASVYEGSEDSVYISCRNLSRVARIDRSTQQIIYSMGFDMPSLDTDFGDDLFSFQHSPQLLPNGNMVLYDNGNRRGHVDRTEGDGISKAIELQFTGDPPTSASIVWEWTLPAYQRAVGDADRLANGNTLVTGGMTGEIWEVSSAGDIVWELELPSGQPDYVIYRAERISQVISGTSLRDTDGDTVADLSDNCPDHSNFNQLDRDGDGVGDECARALGVGVFALPSLSEVGFALLITLMIGVALVAGRVSRVDA